MDFRLDSRVVGPRVCPLEMPPSSVCAACLATVPHSSIALPMPAAPVIGFPEKFELALRYGEGRMAQDVALSDSDKLLLDALAKQATVGPCTEPRPSMFDAVAKARWQAWSELGNRSKMEAMFMYTQAVEELAPDWWQWPPLQLGTGAYIPLATEERGGAATAASSAKMADAEPSVPPPLLLAPNGQPGGGWSALPEMVGSDPNPNPDPDPNPSPPAARRGPRAAHARAAPC